MIYSVALAIVRGMAHVDDLALAAPFGHRSNTTQRAQDAVITTLEEIEGFTNQCGNDDPADSQVGHQNLAVPFIVRLRGCAIFFPS